MKPTRRDSQNSHTRAALAWFAAAQHARASWADEVQANILQHGDVQGSHTSGCYNPAWPEDVKDRLRTLARYIGECTDRAYASWRAAGRKRDTIRPWQDAARRLEGGRASYY